MKHVFFAYLPLLGVDVETSHDVEAVFGKASIVQ